MSIHDLLMSSLGAIITAAIGLVVFVVKSKYNKAVDRQRKEYEERIAADKRSAESRDQNREKYMLLLIQLVGAALALGEANATAMQNGKPNGETHKALEYATKVKHENKDFLAKLGVESIF